MVLSSSSGCCINAWHVSGDTKSSMVNMSGSLDNCLSARMRGCCGCVDSGVDTAADDSADDDGTSDLVVAFDFALDPNPLPLILLLFLLRLLPCLRFLLLA